ncbi:hypothetical protein FGO68_gene16358 [Halteria grandinella]|uniref:phenylalanine--tRNA ligase n=1 Tax=Halteria grandinella TaxID=5974 RepID=A0A8J8P0L2_HALGN|nr:hypothetical protein FGO68_gene16358 [Halteria grandinella]
MVESISAQAVQDLTVQLSNLILGHLAEHGEGIPNTDDFSASKGIKPADLDPVLKSLVAEEYITVKATDKKLLEPTDEGRSYLQSGTPEYQLASALKVGEPIEKKDLEERLGAELVKIGSQKALALKWLKAEGKTAIVRIAETIEDTDKNLLTAFVANPDVTAHTAGDVDKLKKRKLVNIGLSHLLGIMQEFYSKIGIKQLKFKPAYNPYTEPSLEIFGFHPQLKRWVEIGNSGVFRPEMLRPMGLPEDVSVLGWGLSLERPTMIYSTKENKICYINPSH